MKEEKAVERLARALEEGATSSLPEDLNQLLQNVNLADNLIQLHGAGPKCRKFLQERLKVSPTTAYELMRVAQSLFGSRMSHNKAYWRGLVCEELWNTIQAAKEAMWHVRIKDEKPELDGDGNVIKDYVPDKDMMSVIVKASKELNNLLNLDEPEMLFDPRELYTPPMLTTVPEEAGLTTYREVPKQLEEILYKIGAKRDENGNWQ
jgi:hypothetical protein